MEEVLEIALLFVLDGIRQVRYLLLAVAVSAAVLWWIFSSQQDAERACRDKGGVPIVNHNDGVTCTSGVLK